MGMIIPFMGINSQNLSDTLFTKVQQRVLSVIFGQPDRVFFGNEIIRLAGVGVGAVTRELNKLVSSGLIDVTRTGNQKHYQANPSSPIFSELRSIVLKTFGVADVLRQALLPFSDRIRVAFIYGSVAKGKDTAKSDIDLMVVSDNLGFSDIFAVLTEAEKQLGRQVSPTIYTGDEFSKKLRNGSDFINRVTYQPKIFIVGTENDISQLG
jgi:predicted nucleotidyltransferase